jgi:hypothetical protein
VGRGRADDGSDERGPDVEGGDGAVGRMIGRTPRRRIIEWEDRRRGN